MLTVVSVNETTQTQGTLRSEARIAHGALHRLRQDLFVDAFAFRPMPPLEDAKISRWVPWLPERIRHWARWLPHFIVGSFAMCVFLATFTMSYGIGPVRGVLAVGFSVLVSTAPALTLFRPVGAFWLSLLCFVVSLGATAATAYSSYSSAYGNAAFSTHLAVMTLVVLRTRPRLAVEMWLVTFGVGAVLTALVGGVTGDLPPVAFFFRPGTDRRRRGPCLARGAPACRRDPDRHRRGALPAHAPGGACPDRP